MKDVYSILKDRTMFKKLLPLMLVGLSFSAQAILLERSVQGAYNQKPAPAVNEEEAYQARINPQAPRANTGYKHKVYTYDNNVSEYLRDNLNLPKEPANYKLQATSYLKTPQQLPELNSTFPVLEAEKTKGKE